MEWENLELIDFAQDNDKWQAVMNMVMNCRIP
jgi:hypothetical protein